MRLWTFEGLGWHPWQQWCNGERRTYGRGCIGDLPGGQQLDGRSPFFSLKAVPDGFRREEGASAV